MSLIFVVIVVVPVCVADGVLAVVVLCIVAVCAYACVPVCGDGSVLERVHLASAV